MDEAKVKEIFSDEAFVTSLLKIEAPEDVQKALKTKGLELSIEEIKAIGAVLEKAAEKGASLSEADLEKVAGGFAVTVPVVSCVIAGISCTIGAAGFVHNITRGRW
jgi:predicted ribosomally synthesized peptide with nif11-like leader